MLNKDLISKEEMMKIFHDPENIPYNLIEAYYNLAKDIYGDLLVENFLFFKSPFSNISGFNDILSTIEPNLQEAIILRYGLKGSSPLTFKKMGRIYNLSFQAIQKRVYKALNKLRDCSCSEKCTVPWAKNQLLLLYNSLDKPADINMILSLKESQIFEFSLNDPIEELNLSVRTFNALKRNHISTIGQLLSMEHDDFYKIRFLGFHCTNEIWQKLYGKDFYS